MPLYQALGGVGAYIDRIVDKVGFVIFVMKQALIFWTHKRRQQTNTPLYWANSTRYQSSLLPSRDAESSASVAIIAPQTTHCTLVIINKARANLVTIPIHESLCLP